MQTLLLIKSFSRVNALSLAGVDEMNVSESVFIILFFHSFSFWYFIWFVCLFYLLPLSPPCKCILINPLIVLTVSEHSLVLKEVKVPLWPHSKCQSSLRRNFGANYLLPKTNICAGEEGNDACDVST